MYLSILPHPSPPLHPFLGALPPNLHQTMQPQSSTLQCPMCLYRLCADCADFTDSVWTPHSPNQSVRTLQNNCNCPKWNLKWLPVVGYWVCTLPLCHCGLLYPANMCYICNLWLNWETYFLLLNMGHIIYGHDSFFDVNSMAVSISRSD